MEAPRATVARAQELRRELTPPQARLWTALVRRPGGLKFRRQHPLGRLILDFYCHSARLAVEVDGLWHDWGDRPERDERRDAWLAGQGVEVLRIPADAVRENLDYVVGLIVAAAEERRAAAHSTTPSARSPSPRGRGDDV